MLRLIPLAAALAGLLGCGLVDPDITQFDLSMPKRTFTLDTTQWNLAEGDQFPTLDCSSAPSSCAQAVEQVCSGEACSGACGGAGSCEATIAVSLYHGINLYAEKPELQTLDNQPLVNVTIERIYFTITENTLNVASPPIDVYVAPQAVMNPNDSQAERIGVIGSVPAGVKLQNADIDLTPEGRDALRRFMADYQTPFNLIVGTELILQAGDPMPNGRLVAEVSVDAHAGI